MQIVDKFLSPNFLLGIADLADKKSWLGMRVRRASGASQGRKPGVSYDARAEAGSQKIPEEFYCESNPGVRITNHRTRKDESQWTRLFVAGDEGFEPPITGPEPVALPLG